MNNGQHEEVKSLDEALGWFLRHSSGSVRCVDPKGHIKPVDVQSFEEATEFFSEAVLRELEKLK